MQIVTPEEAVAGIRSGDQVYLHCAAATPEVLLAALVERALELRNVGMVHLHTEGPGHHLAPAMAPHFRHRALFIGPNARAAVNDGRADYVPVFLSDVPRLFRSGALPLDAVFVNATPPDVHGFCSLGVSVEAMHAAIATARTVIVQFNQMDFIRGAALADQGKAIIALPATAGDGSISRIVSHLKPGAGVVTTRAHVRTVVTEFGVAELFGRSIRERTAALIGIAHPDHRDHLRAEVRANHDV